MWFSAPVVVEVIKQKIILADDSIIIGIRG
jgi:hypothetical protein